MSPQYSLKTKRKPSFKLLIPNHAFVSTYKLINDIKRLRLMLSHGIHFLCCKREQNKIIKVLIS